MGAHPRNGSHFDDAAHGNWDGAVIADVPGRGIEYEQKRSVPTYQPTYLQVGTQ